MTNLTKLFIFFILISILYLPIFPDLFDTWLTDPDNSHGILIPLISLYLVWQNREKINNSKSNNPLWGLAILMIGLFFYLISYAGDIAVFTRLSLCVTLIGITLYNLGTDIFKIISFPVFFMILMIPVPDTILNLVAFPLQLFATDISARMISALNIPVLTEGNMLHFANTSLEVVAACSGIRSMMTFITLGIFFAYLNRMSFWKGMILLISCIPLALIINIIRVFGTGILAHRYGNDIARGFLHDFSGFIVFGIGLIIIYTENIALNKIERKILHLI